jgi:glycosyltransferase involved in cell wall biosynthesis
MTFSPVVSVITPTFNNVDTLKRSVDAWQHFGGDAIELIVVEDGCRDRTPEYLQELAATPWGRRHLQWIHQDDAHELRCTNSGFEVARGEYLMAWQDDMFLQVYWLIPELVRTFRAYREIGLISLSRGLNCLPLDEPIDRYEALVDWRRLESTIGDGLGNWLRLQEVDVVIRPWIVRKACLDQVGMLDEAFRPTEWDEADLAFRIRRAGWLVATSGYERLGAYFHLGSMTLSRAPSAPYFARVLENGRLFHQRWDATIAAEHPRDRRTWVRRATPAGWIAAVRQMTRYGARRLRRTKT